jgi:hypothetical protein
MSDMSDKTVTDHSADISSTVQTNAGMNIIKEYEINKM